MSKILKEKLAEWLMTEHDVRFRDDLNREIMDIDWGKCRARKVKSLLEYILQVYLIYDSRSKTILTKQFLEHEYEQYFMEELTAELDDKLYIDKH